MSSKKKILIVGGSGFIGYHLAKKCLKKKWQIFSLSTNKPSKSRFLRGVKYLTGDISKKNDLKKKINQNFDYVVNCGGYVDHSKKKKTYNSHFIGCKNLVEIFLKKKLSMFVQIGSSAEYGINKSPFKENINCRPTSIYGRSKLLSTQFLLKNFETKKFPAVILRLFQVYGPNQSTNRIIPIAIDNCLKNKKFPCSSGIQKRDFIFVDDLTQAILLVFIIKQSICKIINIGSVKNYKIKDLVTFINKHIKKGTPLFGKIKMRKDEIKQNYAEISKAKKILNWKPKVKIFDGIIKTINSYDK